ncbi:MAG TPA: chemotaxis protein CheA, partial [Candidatus Desulfofervidus auxilii]|nr:chemotaxis protein CheA [Candidatus Desulfofervidus auxilii]
IRVVVSGADTELDKEMIEFISDPLKHLVRNAVDHGIELPQERTRLGKPSEGTIWLKGYQKEGKIYIEIKDDGRGLDKEAILQKALEQGLIKNGTTLSDEEIYELIFHPYMSTAKEVTEVSGRGVGLDVVKHNITKAGGRIKVFSEAGKGATFVIELPLTLAIIDGTMVKTDGQIFTIPMDFIVEFFKPYPRHLKSVEEREELVNVRGEFLPLIRLDKVFNLRKDISQPQLVAILKGSKKFGLVIDEILGEQRVVIKSLEKNFRNIKGIAGATVLGDGSISLVIDIAGLEELAFS